jgi:hypothetical protein
VKKNVMRFYGLKYQGKVMGSATVDLEQAYFGPSTLIN